MSIREKQTEENKTEERTREEFWGPRTRYQHPFIGADTFWVSETVVTVGFPAHWHGEIELFYLLPGAGKLALTVDGTEYILEAGDAAVIAGTEVHSGHVLEAGARDMVIEMGFSLLREDFFLLAGKRFCNTVLPFSHEEQLTEGQKEIKEILQCIIRERELVDGEMSGWPSANRLRMTALLFSLAAAMVQHLPMIQISSQRVKQLEAMMAVQSVLEYVEQAYPEEITLERAAGISGYEKTRFCQLFKKAVGISFHKYLNERRIRAAVFLLQGTNLPISQIARTVGVGELKTLSRLIRAAYGMTPSQLREQRPEEEKQIQENR